ncbi:hypothetical protein C8Q78DRAFT_585472 [Trametes maxima]|nr:hypothetical protein C8Q78DRAFT_585472 [Trametes maxima]
MRGTLEEGESVRVCVTLFLVHLFPASRTLFIPYRVNACSIGPQSGIVVLMESVGFVEMQYVTISPFRAQVRWNEGAYVQVISQRQPIANISACPSSVQVFNCAVVRQDNMRTHELTRTHSAGPRVQTTHPEACSICSAW